MDERGIAALAGAGFSYLSAAAASGGGASSLPSADGIPDLSPALIRDDSAQARLLLAPQCQIILYNNAAQKLISGSDLFEIRKAFLKIHLKEAQAFILDMLKAIGKPASKTSSERIVVSSDDERFLFVASPVVIAGSDRIGSIQLTICTVGARPQISGRDLMKLFDMTAAEASLAMDLFHGQKVGEIAVRRKVAVSTVRTQLRSLFRKTGTSRQPDLLALLSALFNA